MFTLREQPARFYASARLLRKIVRQLLANVQPLHTRQTLTGNQRLHPTGEQRHRLLLIRDGFLRCKREQRLLYFAEPGDLIHFNALPEAVHIHVDSPVVVDEYQERELLATVRREPMLFDLWMRCLTLNLELITTLVGGDDEAAPDAMDALSPGVVAAQPRADVVVGDTPVGSVLTRELFRLLSEGEDHQTPPGTDTPVLVSVPRRQLLALFRRYPRQALRLLENLGHRLAPTENSSPAPKIPRPRRG